MTIPIDPSNEYICSHLKALVELTQALEKIIQETEIPSPQMISIFFDGMEVYRQKSGDGTVFWWGVNDKHPQHIQHLVTLVPSH